MFALALFQVRYCAFVRIRTKYNLHCILWTINGLATLLNPFLRLMPLLHASINPHPLVSL